MKSVLTATDIQAALEANPEWKLQDGRLVREWEFKDFLGAMSFVNHIAEIAESVGRYLRQIRYEKLGRLDKVWPALRQAVAKSERLTVMFIYDGDDTLRGTPFDKDINALQKKYRREFRAENLPVVTILSARDGQFFDYTINYPGSISVPHTADPLPPPGGYRGRGHRALVQVRRPGRQGCRHRPLRPQRAGQCGHGKARHHRGVGHRRRSGSSGTGVCVMKRLPVDPVIEKRLKTRRNLPKSNSRQTR